MTARMSEAESKPRPPVFGPPIEVMKRCITGEKTNNPQKP